MSPRRWEAVPVGQKRRRKLPKKNLVTLGVNRDWIVTSRISRALWGEAITFNDHVIFFFFFDYVPSTLKFSTLDARHGALHSRRRHRIAQKLHLSSILG